jgi:SAM-dependent methyltransferase
VTDRPRTRWALAGGATRFYGETFARLVSSGKDVDGEARLADALVPRGARILDVGSGMGRVSAALRARGHTVVAIEPDPELVAQSRRTYPDLEVLELDALDLAPGMLGDGPTEFDLAVLVGNVMVYLAEDTEREVLARVRALLAEQGRVLVGFHPTGGPPDARDYLVEEFVADAAAAGLVVDLRAGTYELHPPAPDYVVFVLARDDRVRATG